VTEVSEPRETTTRDTARVAKSHFGFFGEWVLHLVLATAVITAIVDSALNLNGGPTIV
jgi:hypothetical protein